MPYWSFLGGSMVKNLSASAGDTRSIPCPGRSHILWRNEAHAPQLLSPYWAHALEPGNCNYWAHVLRLLKPQCLRARAPKQEKSPQWEVHPPQLECSPHSLQLQKKSLHTKERPEHSEISKERNNFECHIRLSSIFTFTCTYVFGGDRLALLEWVHQTFTLSVHNLIFYT